MLPFRLPCLGQLFSGPGSCARASELGTHTNDKVLTLLRHVLWARGSNPCQCPEALDAVSNIMLKSFVILSASCQYCHCLVCTLIALIACKRC